MTMDSNDSLRPDVMNLTNVPTAADLGYEDSNLCTTKQNGLLKFSLSKPIESNEAWLRIDSDSFVIDLDEWC